MSRRDHHRHQYQERYNKNEHGERLEHNSRHSEKAERRDQPVKKNTFRPTYQELSPEEIRAEEEKIRDFKSQNQFVCSKCGIAISDITSAITDKTGNGIIHFDCALESVSQSEKLENGDKIVYIGNGRFGVLNFPNVHDVKHFTIKKIIEWENKESKPQWRDEMADLYSHVK